MKNLLILSTLLLTACSSQKFKTGYAEINMSVPVGLRLCGTFNPRPSTGVHDPLRVYTHVFSQGNKTAVIAGCDLAMISPIVAEKVRQRLHDDLGIKKNSIIIHASETHNAPDYFGEFFVAFSKEAKEKNKGVDPDEQANFSKILEDSIVDTVKAAFKSMEPASVTYAMAEAKGISFNRRFHMKDGSIGWNPGKGNPNILKPAGPVDPQMPFLMFKQKNTGQVSFLWGFAMHLAILGDSLYAADYPFYVSQNLLKKFPNAGTHFAQVPCCDVIHIDVNNPKKQKGYAWAEVVGNKLAQSLISKIPKSETVEKFNLKSLSKTIYLKTKSYSEKEFTEAKQKWMNPQIRNKLSFSEKIHNATTMGIALRYPDGKIPALIQIIQLSPEIAFVGLPGEVAVELGLKIKSESPYKHTHVIQLSNDWPGYIPTKKIFAGGEYEANVAKISPGEGELMAAEAVKLLKKLYTEEN